ncbi:hypothetical protein [Amycolatopsis vancoresmycina]|uniref:hypothetical protein n=1 Tax=Amycolatopsis vancoresmycina TaxID=208444 RepID=UPI001FD0CB46|nr:hypothetical protein [Amycolatopsis vancoresmycina]
MSSTADVRRGAPALTPGETPSYARVRAPRPWAASLQRPAAKILFAGGLTVAGWLLGAALTGSTASAAEAPTCPEAPVVSTVDHAAKPLLPGRHRKHHHDTDAAACPVQPKADTAEPPAETTKDTEAPKAEEASGTTKDTKTTEAPATTKATSSGGLVNGLVGGTLNAVGGVVGTTKDTVTAAPGGGGVAGGLVGGVLDVVGGTLSTVTGTVGSLTDTVGTLTDTLSHTVLSPLTQPSPNNPDAPVLLPLDDVLGPVLGGSNSGGGTATVPVVTTVVTQAAAAEPAADAVTTTTTAADPQTTRVSVTHLVVRHAQSLPAVQEQPRDSGTHATGGGDSTPGLPGGTTAPSAPALTATPGHDGPGGARHAFAVHTDRVTTTQLKLIGTSRDHEVDGAGREAALPTTSPD